MLVDRNITDIVCDCCNKVIDPSNVVGSNAYTKNSTGKKGIDICANCSFMMFDRFVMPYLSTETLEEYIEVLKPTISKIDRNIILI
jgi:hypothetical protein